MSSGGNTYLRDTGHSSMRFADVLSGSVSLCTQVRYADGFDLPIVVYDSSEVAVLVETYQRLSGIASAFSLAPELVTPYSLRLDVVYLDDGSRGGLRRHLSLNAMEALCQLSLPEIDAIANAQARRLIAGGAGQRVRTAIADLFGRLPQPRRVPVVLGGFAP